MRKIDPVNSILRSMNIGVLIRHLALVDHDAGKPNPVCACVITACITALVIGECSSRVRRDDLLSKCGKRRGHVVGDDAELGSQATRGVTGGVSLAM